MTVWTTSSTPNVVESDRCSSDLHPKWLSNSSVSCNDMVSNSTLLLRVSKALFLNIFYSIQDTLANLRSLMTIAQAKLSFNWTAISTKRVSFLLASTSNILKSSPGSTCCYLLEVSENSSSYVSALSCTNPHVIFFFALVRPRLLESLTTKKLVGRLWEENFWAMCIKWCSSCRIINLRHLLVLS